VVGLALGGPCSVGATYLGGTSFGSTCGPLGAGFPAILGQLVGLLASTGAGTWAHLWAS
jgi:hypothetical protein